jgi:hypothetical protein
MDRRSSNTARCLLAVVVFASLTAFSTGCSPDESTRIQEQHYNDEMETLMRENNRREYEEDWADDQAALERYREQQKRGN